MLSYTNNNVQEYEKTNNSMNNFIKVKEILVLFDRFDFSLQRPTINDKIAMRVEYSNLFNGVMTHTRLLLSSRPPPRTIQNVFTYLLNTRCLRL